MYIRIHCLIHTLIAAALICAAAASAQGPSAQGTGLTGQVAGATATTAVLHGHIADPTGALIPGAKISVLNASGKVVATTSADSAGAYEVRGLAPGAYTVRAEFSGFAPFHSSAIEIGAGQAKRVDITMAIQVEQQNVTVTDETPHVNVEAGGNVNAITLKGKDLDALSDDPDELQSELQALAGPAAGPNGGQIYIDGFSGGQLPPKSAIREIKINSNPFSAEYDKLGYGRIEIFTKPGTDKLHGHFFSMGNDKAFNTGNPFVQTLPSYYSYMFNGTLSGPINKHASYFLSADRRHIGNVNAWLIPVAVLPDSSGTFVSSPNYGVSLPNTRVRTNASARVDLQLGTRNTLTLRYGFWAEGETGDLNAGSFPTASTHANDTDHTVQASDAFVISDHIVNETRFQYDRSNDNEYPDSTMRTIQAEGDFTYGGAPGQLDRSHETRLELWNITTINHGPHSIEFGTRMRDYYLADNTTNNYNGTFRFATATHQTASGPAKITPDQVYLNMANGLASGQSFNSLVAQGYGPVTLSYTYGPSATSVNRYDVALFAQDDWKVSPRFTFSAGLRFEAQNHVADHNDWAPRVSMAYALDGGKGKQAKTVLRAGVGTFYDRFGTGNLLTIKHLQLQNKIVLNNPVCSTSATSLDAIDLTSCSSGPGSSSSQSSPVHYSIDPSYRSPYTTQFGASIERQVTKTTSATLTYLRSMGPHQLVTVNANQFNPAINAYPIDPTGGYIYQYTPEAIFKENQLIASVNATLTKRLSVVGFYTLASASSNGGAGSHASNAYNLSQDYGPATFNSRNQIFTMASYTGPWGLRFNPFLIAQSGKPFNITLPSDPLNNFYNQRPTYATTSTPAQDRYDTPWGVMDIAALPGEQLIPANLGVGPAAVAVNLRVSRGFGFGPEVGGTSGGGWHGGGPHGHGGPPGGSLGPGGLGGGPGAMRGMFGGGANRKYNLTLTAQALNLFNDINYGGPNGTLGTYRFLQSNTLANGIYSSGAASRRIFVQAIFSF